MNHSLEEKVNLPHSVYGAISRQRLDEISRYASGSITVQKFRNAQRNPLLLQDLKDILLYHPNPIIRHEAAFIIGELKLPIAHLLIPAVKYDRSIVVKHEAIEALGRTNDYGDACMAYVFLKKITKTPEKYDAGVAHEDVQITAQEALKELQERYSTVERDTKRHFPKPL